MLKRIISVLTLLTLSFQSMAVDIKRLDRVDERKLFDDVIKSNDKAIDDRIYELKRASFK